MDDKDEIVRRLEGLEKENQRLKLKLENVEKSRSGPAKPDHVTVYESAYQGHPVLKFSIGKRFFSMGLRRLAAVLAAKDLIVDFVKRHDSSLLDWTAEHGGVVEEDKDPGDGDGVKI